MTIVSDARSVLQNGASTVLSTVRRNKTTRRLLPAKTRKMMKHLNRRIEPRRPRVLPLVLVATGLSLVATAISLLLSRYLRARSLDDGTVESAEGPVVSEEAVLAD